jgi:hypothetical protein
LLAVSVAEVAEAFKCPFEVDVIEMPVNICGCLDSPMLRERCASLHGWTGSGRSRMESETPERDRGRSKGETKRPTRPEQFSGAFVRSGANQAAAVSKRFSANVRCCLDPEDRGSAAPRQDSTRGRLT